MHTYGNISFSGEKKYYVDVHIIINHILEIKETWIYWKLIKIEAESIVYYTLAKASYDMNWQRLQTMKYNWEQEMEGTVFKSGFI